MGITKVYVIEAGVYSDRHIVAVTLNKEDAYKLRDAAEEDDYSDAASVFEFETDEYKIIDDERRMYQVEIHKDSTVRAHLRGRVCDFIDAEGSWFFEDAGLYYFNVRANNKEEAKKIALDRFAEWKARKEGIV